MKNFKILFNFATRSRPKKFINVINQLCDRLYDYENCIILVSIDNDDETMKSDEIKNFISNHRYSNIIKLFSSNPKGKISATQCNVNKIFDWDIVMNVADDFEFPKENIDLHIRKYMEEFYPDLDGILHFPDGIQNEVMCTHPVMGRKYYERFGFIFNPIYKSFYCDDELTDIGKILNKITYINDFIYLHKHYYFNPESMDELDIINEKYALIDRETYHNRKKNNFNFMKITQVTPGIITIPPNGWGAVEKVIWEYYNNIKELGHKCDIKYLNEVDTDSSDIIHIHMANLAIEAANQGIPYIFSLHDHHVVYYGKDSSNYQQNLEAIKRSVISFTHAEFLVDYFDETDKLFYLSHGVNTEFFKNDKPKRTEHKLLCLANNGIGGDSTYDRKGFRYAIEAAIQLDLPITVAGPENNRIFFEHHNDLLNYDKLTLMFSNPNEEQILELYKSHSIFLHPSMLEAGHPNLTLLEAVSCNMPVVGTYLGSQTIEGMVVVERDVNQIVSGVKQVIDNYDLYLSNTELDRQKYDWSVISKRMVRIYEDLINSRKNLNSIETKQRFDKVFENTEIKPKEMVEKIEVINHYINGALVEIKGNTDKKYLVEFWNQNSDCEYREEIGCNMWVKLNKKYFDEYTLKVYSDGHLISEKKYNAENKRVYIALDSKSLGDTFAWVPYADEFRKKHNCKVICSTFFNDLFVKQYPEIQFVPPGSTVDNLYAMYEIGWFYDGDNVKMDRHPSDFKLGPLQKTATDILGLEYKEVKPLIKNPNKLKKKRVGLGIHSTAQSKYWNNPKGWQDITDYLISLGYEVIIYSKEEDGYMGNFYPKGAKQNPPGSIYKLIEELSTCEFFIGISSGISWVTWALDIPTVLISGFTEEFNEPYNNVYKVSAPENTCRGCANKFRLDPGDWNWCPINKGNEKMFECSKKITSEMVKDKIIELLGK